MSTANLLTKSESQTQAVGSRLAKCLRPGDTVVLTGDLAAGKTAMAKGIASGLGIDSAEVTSPAYDLVHEFYGGIIPLFHLDFYRLDELGSSDAQWIEEYIYGNGICLLEWGDRFSGLLPIDYLLIHIDIVDEESRRITFDSVGQRFAKLIAEVAGWRSYSG